LQQLIKNKNISVILDTKETVTAYYDEDRIIQVVTNLLSNAIKFCPEVGGMITITLQEQEAMIQTSVQDNGKASQPPTSKSSSTSFTNP